MVKIDGSKSALLMEVGAVVTLENKKLIVSNVFGKEMRKEENKKADIQKGDEVLYVNGKRISDPKELRKIYEDVKTGGDIKLGIDRGGNKFFVTFKKDDAPQGMRRIIKSGPDGKMRDENGNEIKGNVIKAGGKNINIDSLSKSGKVKIITK
jgi:hypothetical protein